MSPRARAFTWMIGSVFCFTAMAVAGREVSVTHGTFEIMLYRSVVGFVLLCSVTGVTGRLRREVNTERFGLHILRNASHFAGQNLWFFAVGAIPLAQVFSLEFLQPIWAILLAPLILGEPIRRMGLVVAAIGFAGILVVAQPGSAALSPGLLAAATCGIGLALSALLTRRLTRGTTVTCILFWLTLMQAVFGLVCAGFDGDIGLPTPDTAPWLLLIGVAGLSAHVCLTSALRLAPAAVILPVDFARLPIIAMVDVYAYGEPLSSALFLGAALIIGANLLNLRRGAP